MKTDPGATTDGDLTLHGLWEDLLSIVSRRKALVSVVALGSAISVYVGLMFVGDVFEAQASLLVKVGRENLEIPVTVGNGAYFPTGVRKEEVNSYIALLTSRALLEETLGEVGHGRFSPELPKPETLFGWVKYAAKTTVRWGRRQLNELQILLALKRRLTPEELAYIAVSRSLKVERFKDADVIDIRLRLPDAGLARDFLKILTEKYLVRHVEVMIPDQSAFEVFEQEVKTYGDSLMALRERNGALKSALGVAAVVEQKQQLLEMLRVAELQRLEMERERARNDAEHRAIGERRSRVEELYLSTRSVAPSATTRRIGEVLAELRVGRTLALTKYQPGADPVQKIEAQIADLESTLRQAEPDVDTGRVLARTPSAVALETKAVENEIDAESIAAGIRSAEEQIETIKERLKRFDQAEGELQRLQMEISITEARLLSNTSRREEARGQETLNRWKVANVSLLGAASYSEKPVAPNRVLIMVMGVAGGILAGVVVALLLEWEAEVIHTPRDLDRIEPNLCLGFLPGLAGAGSASGNERSSG